MANYIPIFNPRTKNNDATREINACTGSKNKNLNINCLASK